MSYNGRTDCRCYRLKRGEKKVFGAEKAQSYEAMIYVVYFASFCVVGV